MEVDFKFLCDYAGHSGGTLTAVGVGFDTIYAKQMPATHPLFFAVVRLRFSRVETGQKHIRVHLQDADGSDIVPRLETTITVIPPHPSYIYRTNTVSLGFWGVQFPKYGDYQISWLVDDLDVAQIQLKVMLPPPQQATPLS